MSERSQIVVVWWALAFTAIYGIALGLLLDMIPPPDAVMDAQAIDAWYDDRHTQVRVGAVIAAWTGAFMLPLAAVIALQMRRQERGRPIWSLLTICGGAMMSIFLVLPPLFFGVAAFSPDRSPEVTALMHELGLLTLVTTDQYYIFMWVAIAVICLTPTTVRHSPFPRWFGYLTIWTALMFEAGAIAFLPRTGAFAWNGLFVFWSPLTLFGLWIGVQSWLLLRSLKAQRLEEQEQPQPVADVPAAAQPTLA
ncbi:hypothetical protein [Conexibacter sp. SYSU D00693]|uniref:hypothetical protein n=1 Tax=Conexibacter sp. SYSU D00693 TaxID=2812560 RepID=UPI00196B025A|nr:hypothetical protein [Conexibacter sp. SYSU D00693]